ncbi:MAG: hypothetical protein ACRDTC_16800 [Pseudonocardiaceae bacterium]
MSFPLTDENPPREIAKDLLDEKILIKGIPEPVHLLYPVPKDNNDAELIILKLKKYKNEEKEKESKPGEVLPAERAPESLAYKFACLTGVIDERTISVNYPRERAPLLVDAVGARFGEELAEANTDEDKRLAAIAKVIRALHVIHPFTGGNGRTNITLLLTKLLLDSGFTPTILKNMDNLFSGTYTIEEIVDGIREGFIEFTKRKGELARQPSIPSVAPSSDLPEIPSAIQWAFKRAMRSCTII